MRTSVLLTVLAVALAAGTACAGPDDQDADIDNTVGIARASNVVPIPADTSARATVAFNVASLQYGYTIESAPPGTIDSIALYQVAAGTVLPANATAILCAGAAACAASSGTATLVGAATSNSIRTSIRAYGTQVVIFTTATAATRASGAIRGTMYPNPQD